MANTKVRPSFITALIIVLFFAIAFSLRVFPSYHHVFTGGWIKFTGNDAYYQMHLVDNIVRNFPHTTTFSPYLLFPGGQSIGPTHFFNWILASIIWIAGLGSPSPHLIDVIGVYFPAILGALTVIPVYFIGRELAGRWAGLIAAGLLAVLPGEFMGRSVLGFTDLHIAETLLTTVTMLFLILAVRRAGQIKLSYNDLKQMEWRKLAKPTIYSILAGFFLGLFIFAWQGALLFVFITALYFIVQFIVDHLKGRATDYLSITGTIFFLTALVISQLVSSGELYLYSLLIALFIAIAFNIISRLMVMKAIRKVYYPLSLVGLGLVGLVVLYISNASLARTMLDTFTLLIPTGAHVTTIETQPLLSPAGEFTLAVAWGNFTTGFFLSLISLGLLIYLIVRRGEADKTLLVVWSLMMLVATLAQRRFAYYFAVNVALLTGYLSILIYYVMKWLFVRWSGERTGRLSWQILETGNIEAMSQPVEIRPKPTTKKARRLERKKTRELTIKQARMRRRRATGFNLTGSQLGIGLSAIVIFLLVFSPVVVFPEPGQSPAMVAASQAPFAPSDGWCQALSWLAENTSEPFNDPNFYYHLETSKKYTAVYELIRNVHNPSGDPKFYYQLEASYRYPEAAYGVLAWWDYGYWITRSAHRIPNANPSQDPTALPRVATFFTSLDEESANKIAQELGPAYVVLDYETASSKFWAIATWAGKPLTDFFATYWSPADNSQRTYINADYYRSLSSRLYNFDGKAVKPEKTLVIAYELRTTVDGLEYRELLSEEEFISYEEAEAYIASQKSGNYRIVGTDPLLSPVPLEELKQYKLVYSSEETVASNQGAIPAVKVFEFTDRVSPYKP